MFQTFQKTQMFRWFQTRPTNQMFRWFQTRPTNQMFQTFQMFQWSLINHRSQFVRVE
jgi:hypothetical protein